MIHDFAITQSHAVFWIGPVVFGPDPAKKGSTIPFHWDASKGSRVGIMPLEGPASQIVWVDMPPCFVFHGLNAHDDGQKVVLLVHKLKSAFGPTAISCPRTCIGGNPARWNGPTNRCSFPAGRARATAG